MKKDNPWKTLSSEIKYSNPWISVREDKVIRPDGKDGIYGVVSPKIATGVIALTEDEQVYLVGQYRYPTDEYSWEIVEGAAEDGETPIEGAKRELSEEAKLSAKEWLQLGDEIHLSNCFTDERGYLFLATGLSTSNGIADGCEELVIKVVPFEQALRMCQDGEIKDAMSIIGLMRLDSFLKS